MSIVTKHNGEGGSTEGMFFHAFSGRPVDQYEWPHGDDPRANIGDVFVVEVRCEVTKVVTDEIKDGQRQTIGFKVIDSKPGRMVAKANGNDPNQTSIDDVDEPDNVTTADFGDYPSDENTGDGDTATYSPFKTPE